MKYIFFSLLLINLAYLSYEQFEGDSKGESESYVVTGSSAQNISLLNELTGSERKQALNDVVTNPLKRGSLSAVGSEHCFGIGPFPDVFGGQSALEQIEALQIFVSLKAIDVPSGEKDYRVMIPPAASAEEAFRKLRELQASDIDSYVISKGNLALGISLGVFSSEGSANALRSRLGEMGYDVEIATIDRLTRSYWVVASEAEFEAFESSQWLSRRQELTTREMMCADVE